MEKMDRITSIMALPNSSVRGTWARGILGLAGAVSFFLSQVYAHAQSGCSWARGIQTEPANSIDRAHRFELDGVSQYDHLRGNFFYMNGTGRQVATTVVMTGTKSPDGNFWPDVTFQVRDENTGEWKTIGKSAPEGDYATVTIEPEGENSELCVKLDIFKPILDQCEFGRIVLSSGETSQFELKYLKPPPMESAMPREGNKQSMRGFSLSLRQAS